MQNPLNLGILGLGEHRWQSLSTFHRTVKKLSNFEIENLLIDFCDVLTNFIYILPIIGPLSKKSIFFKTNVQQHKPIGE